MSIQIAIQYRDTPVTYDVSIQEGKIYHLRLNGENNHCPNGDYIPEKIVIRRKGKIWISDMDNYDELFNCLMEEIKEFEPELKDQ